MTGGGSAALARRSALAAAYGFKGGSVDHGDGEDWSAFCGQCLTVAGEPDQTGADLALF
jgi:hypothetical protein